jgi:hypothetical protein
MGGVSGEECTSCIQRRCASELGACIADMLGAGGTAGGGAEGCIGCGDFVLEPGSSTSDLCRASAALLLTFVTCVCGEDADTPGECG